AIGALLQALTGSAASSWIEPVLLERSLVAMDLSELVREIRRGDVDTLVILGANPSYTAPADLELSSLIRTVPTSLYLGEYQDETAADVVWFVPAAHYLESWGDARAYDGTFSFVQPVIDPLYGGRTVTEILALLGGDSFPSAHRLLRG